VRLSCAGYFSGVRVLSIRILRVLKSGGAAALEVCCGGAAVTRGSSPVGKTVWLAGGGDRSRRDLSPPSNNERNACDHMWWCLLCHIACVIRRKHTTGSLDGHALRSSSCSGLHGRRRRPARCAAGGWYEWHASAARRSVQGADRHADGQLDVAGGDRYRPGVGAVGGDDGVGDIRAPEKLFRVAGGIVVILVLIPAVLA
jgi:hypothetical protein